MFIEENGFNISGGEKAKIVLARALLKGGDILVIDEGFNELDINSERIIMKNIFKYCSDKTIIVVSHRLDNLDLFDHFIEISNGMVRNNSRKESICF
jgi:ABC-type transport system involved in cytochrome bd biosynthesis fused ATPase/permease subunit